MTRRDNALSPDEQERVCEALRSLRKTLGSQVAVADKVGTTQQSVGRVLSGRVPAGPDLARKVAAAIGQSYEQLLARAVVSRTEPRLRDLPGWAEAEATARKQFRFVPPAAWDAVGNLRTANPPVHVTSEWVGTMASHWAQVLSGQGDETAHWQEELRKKRASREHKS